MSYIKVGKIADKYHKPIANCQLIQLLVKIKEQRDKL